MKKSALFIGIAAILAMTSCQQTENYTSVQDFFSKNGVPMQTNTINGTTGGSFTTPQGTVVTIPPNAFVTQASVPVTGDVTIEFKDIYKKSDMLLSNMPTTDYTGAPLKSGGEFFIKASVSGSAVLLAPGKKIMVSQPAALTGGLDTVNVMQAFVAIKNDTTGNVSPWYLSSSDSVFYTTQNYIYELYQTGSVVVTWGNSDNPSFFSAYPQTSLTLHPNESINVYNMYLYLLFNNISSAVHVYDDGTNFPYYNAPQGLQCTVVAFGVKDGNLYSSFSLITIGSNQTYNFSLSQTTTAEFKTQLEALN